MFILASVVYAAAAARWRTLRRLSHYLEGYPYQPHHEYTETFTTDPYYVMLDVKIMPSEILYGHSLAQLYVALQELIDRRAWHISREVEIVNIPGELREAAPVPDLAVWPLRNPLEEGEAKPAYDFRQTGPPRLILEVAFPSPQEVTANDRHDKFATYARMGVREYWLLDTEEPATLRGFHLTQDGGVYVPVPAVDDGGDSAVLGTALRWDAEREELQRRDDPRGIWVAVSVPPDTDGRGPG